MNKVPGQERCQKPVAMSCGVPVIAAVKDGVVVFRDLKIRKDIMLNMTIMKMNNVRSNTNLVDSGM